jgi:3-deoxy-7-phosphoheptulonate synthase
VQVALDAIKAASNPHQFLGVTKQGLTAIVRTRGNDACHIVLRGGKGGPNYDGESVQKTVELARKAKLSTSIMIDCSHDNSRKNHANQPIVSAAIVRQPHAHRLISFIIKRSRTTRHTRHTTHRRSRWRLGVPTSSE